MKRDQNQQWFDLVSKYCKYINSIILYVIELKNALSFLNKIWLTDNCRNRQLEDWRAAGREVR